MDVTNVGNVVWGTPNASALRTVRQQSDELRTQLYGNDIDSSDTNDAAAAGVVANNTEQLGVVNTENNVSNYFSYMNNADSDANANVAWGTGVLEGQSLTATMGEITQRSQQLGVQIGIDSARGYDVSESQEALSNLNANYDVLESVSAAEAGESSTPAFAVDRAFEGSVSEQVVAASEGTQPGIMPGELSIAEQIAHDIRSEYAATENILIDQ